MEIVLLAISAVVVIAGFVYFVSVRLIPQDSYDDIMAEKRRRLEEDDKSRTDKLKEKKLGKKKKKAPKDSTEAVVEKDMDSEHSLPNSQSEAIPSSPEQSPVASKKVVKAVSQRLEVAPEPEVEVLEQPIIAVSAVTSAAPLKSAPPSKLDIGEPHARKKRVAPKIEATVVPEVKESEAQTSLDPTPASTPVDSSSPTPPDPSSPQSAAALIKKKAKLKKPSGPSEGVVNYAAVLRKAPLSDDSIQQLIEILLNKQQNATPDAEWIQHGRTDSIPALKKQLEDKEVALTNAEKLSKDATETVRKLRNELIAAQSKVSTAEKVLREQTQKLQQDRTALMKENQKERDRIAAEASNYESRIQQDATIALNELRGQLRDLQRNYEAQIALTQQHKENLEEVSSEFHRVGEAHRVAVDELTKVKQEILKLNDELACVSRDGKSKMDAALENHHHEISRVQQERDAAQAALQKVEEKLSESQKSGDNSAKVLADKAEVEANLRSAREECETLKQSLRAVEESKTLEVSRLEHELGEVNARLIVAQNEAKASEAVKNEDTTDQSSSSAERIKELEKALEDERTSRLQESQSSERTADELRTKLQQAEAKADASVTTEKLRHIFPDLPKEEEDCGKLLKVIQNRADELVKVKNELNVVKQDLEGVNREKIDLKTKLEVAEKRAEISVNAEDLSRANEKIARLEQDLKESLGQRDNLKIEIEAKLGKIEELENDLKRSAHEAGDISALRKELSDSEVRVKELLSAQARVQEAESELSRISELEAKLHEAEAKTKDLEKMNQILAEYEKAVVEIERDAEQKEAAWRKEIEAKDEKMLQVEDENVKLNAALSGLKSAEDVANELQEKLRDLQSKLQMEEEQRSSFQAKYEETFQNMADVQKELDAANARLTDVESAEKANAEIETLSRELSSLKEQVAGLQVDLKTKSELVEKLNTDLAAKAEEFHNMEKNLQSERETGQQHQRIAEELKEQLKDYQGQKAQPNGFGDHAGDGQLNQSETPLKQVPTAPSPVGQASPSPSAKSLNSEVSLGEDVTTPDGEKKKKKRRGQAARKD